MPLDGSASVEPQMEHGIIVEALSKIVHSLPQSRQLTFRKRPPNISPLSLVDEFELPSSLPLGRVGLASLGASEYQIDSLSRLLSGWLRPGEATVPRGNTAKPPLSPLEFTCRPLPDTLHGVFRVLASGWAVAHDLSWHLHHPVTSARCAPRATDGPYMNYVERLSNCSEDYRP